MSGATADFERIFAPLGRTLLIENSVGSWKSLNWNDQ
jgi:hypothetical protein